MVYWGLYWGPPSYQNYMLGLKQNLVCACVGIVLGRVSFPRSLGIMEPTLPVLESPVTMLIILTILTILTLITIMNIITIITIVTTIATLTINILTETEVDDGLRK